MDYTASMIEKIIVERNEAVDSAILGEIQKIAVENGIETKIILNTKNVVDALRNFQDGYATVKAEIAREIFAEIVKTVFSKIPNEIMFINKERDFSDGVILGKREAFFDMINNLAELKKKYIGEQK